MRKVIGIVLAISFVAALGVWIRSANHANSSVPAAAEATMLPLELERKANKDLPDNTVLKPTGESPTARARRGADGTARYFRSPATCAAPRSRGNRATLAKPLLAGIARGNAPRCSWRAGWGREGVYVGFVMLRSEVPAVPHWPARHAPWLPPASSRPRPPIPYRLGASRAHPSGGSLR
jgi:hypothetical protein